MMMMNESEYEINETNNWDSHEERFNRRARPVIKYLDTRCRELPDSYFYLWQTLNSASDILDKPREERNFRLFINLMLRATAQLTNILEDR